MIYRQACLFGSISTIVDMCSIVSVVDISRTLDYTHRSTFLLFPAVARNLPMRLKSNVGSLFEILGCVFFPWKTFCLCSPCPAEFSMTWISTIVSMGDQLLPCLLILSFSFDLLYLSF